MSIKTLVDDIYSTLEKGVDVPEEMVEKFGHSLALMLKERLLPRQGKPILRMSMLGEKCHRKLWYTINEPDKAEPLSGQTKFKFLYGDVIESLALWLAEVSGHKVEGAQLEVDIGGVKGHSDAFIDGVLVDVKSANSRSYQKFQRHKLEEEDPFGYLDQGNAYLFANQDNPNLEVKKEFAFLAVDKELGKMCLDFYKSNGKDYKKLVSTLQEMLSQPKPPAKVYMPEPEGKSGNLKLGTNCSYCDFKKHCWPGVRTFLYSKGPVYLTHVAKLPDVEEVK